MVRLAPGETILVENSTDYLSQAVIGAAHRLRGRDLTTVSSEPDRTSVVAQFGLDLSEIIDSRVEDLSAYLQQLTGRVGVNAIVTYSADFIARRFMPSWIGPFGRLLLVVETKWTTMIFLPSNFRLTNLLISIINLRKILEDNAGLFQKQLQKAPILLREAPNIGPVRIMSLSELGEV